MEEEEDCRKMLQAEAGAKILFALLKVIENIQMNQPTRCSN
jgi:hypothetical protein